MIQPILWYLSISLVGWLTFPLAFKLLPALPDRGYTFTRTLGLLLWGYIFWLLASLGILRNELGGLLFALLVLIVLSGWALRGNSLEDLVGWLRRQRFLILSVEALFLLAFAWMAFVRAANPEISGTEKPMELAFINAILHSPEFPPHDPWLSGYAISYYYFGYVMVAMLARLTGIAGSVAFNLGITLVFALSAVGAYGIVYNLLALRSQRIMRRSSPRASRNLFHALLGPVFILFLGNLEGFLEVLHARGLFWRPGPGGELSSPFWTWLDLRELSLPPAQPFTWIPTRYLWWWRASRVLQDYDFAGNWKEVIDEFPVFSYLLADLHPHVLAMPFAFLAMALALNLFLGGGEGRVNWVRRLSVRTLGSVSAFLVLGGIAGFIFGAAGQDLRLIFLSLLAGITGGYVFSAIPPEARMQGLSLFTSDGQGEKELGISLEISLPAFLLGAVCLGGLAFLNTWDFPFYVALFAGVYIVGRMKTNHTGWWTGTRQFIGMGMALGLAGILLYLPFYLGFSSQAGGILPSLVYVTSGVHLWIMFAPLLVPLFVFLVYRWSRRSGSWRWQGFATAGGLVLVLWVLMLALSTAITMVPGVGDIFLNNLAAPGLGDLLGQSVLRRFTSPGAWITLLILLAITLGLIIKGLGEKGSGEMETEEKERSRVSRPISALYPVSPDLFVLVLVLLGSLLVLGPEFFYLRDLFGYRINTIFKFYYQTWLLWGVAAAFASAVLLQTLKRVGGLLFSLGLILVIGMGLTYTVLGMWDKTSGFKPPLGFTLDGTAHLVTQAPSEMDAAAWLSAAPPGVVAEAVGGSYSIYGRVSTLSGQPTVLGWDFHETQWRGGGLEIGSRQSDVMRMYCSRDWTEASEITQLYQIRYIVVGNLERETYTPQACPGGLNENKFARNLPVAYQQGDVTIYAVP